MTTGKLEGTIRDLRYKNAVLEDMLLEVMKNADACQRNTRSIDSINWLDRKHWLKSVKRLYQYRYDEILQEPQDSEEVKHKGYF